MTTETKRSPACSCELPERFASPIRRYLSELIHGAADRIGGAVGASPYTVPAVEPIATTDDPATPERRRELAARLLASAIRRYDETSLEWTAVHESFPPLDEPRVPDGPAEYAEWQAWRKLMTQADESFNHAELNLAERIQSLYDQLAPSGRKVYDSATEYFVPRAVKSGGNVYVLAYNAFEYEPKTNIIAVHRSPLVLDLAGDAAREVA